MTTRAVLDQVLETLPEDRLRAVIDFARFLAWQEEQRDWHRFGQAQLARAYGPDEPDYNEADIKLGREP